MKDMGVVTCKTNHQNYQVAAEIGDFGPQQVVAWRCGARPVDFVFDADGFTDPLLNEINTHVLLKVYGNPCKMPEPSDFDDALVVPA